MIRTLEVLAWLAALWVGIAMAAGLWLGLDGAILHATLERCSECGRLGWAHDGPPHPDGCPVHRAHLGWVRHRRAH